jgi:Domain of unknown function (DUF5658)
LVIERMTRSARNEELPIMFRNAAAAALTVMLTATSGFAAEPAERDAMAKAADSRDVTLAGDVDWSLAPVQIGGVTRRPATIGVLSASLAALQVFDIYSTNKGLSQGAREANPLMQGVVGNKATFWAMKAATTAVPMVIASRMWKRNKAGAIATLVIANGVSAMVAARNASVLKQTR